MLCQGDDSIFCKLDLASVTHDASADIEPFRGFTVGRVKFHVNAEYAYLRFFNVSRSAKGRGHRKSGSDAEVFATQRAELERDPFHQGEKARLRQRFSRGKSLCSIGFLVVIGYSRASMVVLNAQKMIRSSCTPPAAFDSVQSGHIHAYLDP